MHSMMKDEHLLMERAACVCENRRMFVSASTDRPEQSVSVFLIWIWILDVDMIFCSDPESDTKEC